MDKMHLKCDCIIGSILNGLRQPVVFSFALSSAPGNRKEKEPRIKNLKNVIKSVLLHITFYLEDDDQKLVDFIWRNAILFCQLIKK